MSRSIASLVACLLVSAVAAFAADGGALRLGSDVWPPFTDVDGKARVAIDLVEQALQRAGFEADSEVRSDFGDVVASIRKGDLDGSAALWRSAERAELLVFSRPYLENRLVLVGLKGSDIGATSFAELIGRRVAIVGSYDYGDAVKKDSGVKFVEGPSDGENLQKLLRREVDYVLADALLVHHLFARHEAKAQRLLQVGTRALAVRSLHLALRRDHPDAAKIVAAFDAEIRRMMTDGSYNEILQMDWIQADVDGDGKIELILSGREAGEKPPTGSYRVFDVPAQPSDRVEVGYFVAGQRYDDWQQVPAEYKVPTKQDIRAETEGGRPAILLFDF